MTSQYIITVLSFISGKDLIGKIKAEFRSSTYIRQMCGSSFYICKFKGKSLYEIDINSASRGYGPGKGMAVKS